MDTANWNTAFEFISVKCAQPTQRNIFIPYFGIEALSVLYNFVISLVVKEKVNFVPN
jgi:hypothetical protein